MVNWKELDWHLISESPNFGRSGKRRVDVFLSDNKMVWPAMLTQETYSVIHEPHMWPKAVKWAYNRGELALSQTS